MAEPVFAMIEAPVPLTILPVKVATSVMKMPMSPVMVPPGLMPLTEAELTMLPVNDDTPANGSGSESASSVSNSPAPMAMPSPPDEMTPLLVMPPSKVAILT